MDGKEYVHPVLLGAIEHTIRGQGVRFDDARATGNLIKIRTEYGKLELVLKGSSGEAFIRGYDLGWKIMGNTCYIAGSLVAAGSSMIQQGRMVVGSYLEISPLRGIPLTTSEVMHVSIVNDKAGADQLVKLVELMEKK